MNAEKKLNILNRKMNENELFLFIMILFSIVFLTISIGTEVYFKFGSFL